MAAVAGRTALRCLDIQEIPTGRTHRVTLELASHEAERGGGRHSVGKSHSEAAHDRPPRRTELWARYRRGRILVEAGIRTAASRQGETRSDGERAPWRNQSAEHTGPVGGAPEHNAAADRRSLHAWGLQSVSGARRHAAQSCRSPSARRDALPAEGETEPTIAAPRGETLRTIAGRPTIRESTRRFKV